MGKFVEYPTEGKLNPTLAKLLGDLLRKEVVRGVMVPATQPSGPMVHQTLVADPDSLEVVDPFAPVVPTNGAKLVASLTGKPSGQPLAAVLRSCEVRGFIELAKLHQGNTDDLLIIGLDCLGRYENRDFLAREDKGDGASLAFLKAATNGGDTKLSSGADIADACKACEDVVPKGVDLRLCVLGADLDKSLWIEAVTEKGEAALETLGLTPNGEVPAERDEALSKLVGERQTFREAMLKAFEEKTPDIATLSETVAACINCYNCRVACPVCYCRECVFGTDTFRHEGEQYLKWSLKRGQVKMPTDTVFYHLTRMVHMSTLCVGCGQCTSACPNDVPVMELFTSVAKRTQARFDYVPGRSLEEGQPLAIFHAEEYDDVTGQVK